MAKLMKAGTALCFMAAATAALLYRSNHADLCLTLAITFGTAAYHLGIRLFVGLAFNLFMKNQANCAKKWYQIHPWEIKLYRLLKVKAWKGRMPTYHPETFSSQKHTWNEIAQAMCQSELVHEANIALSFAPLMASLYFGAFPVFLITSLCSALLDLPFVIIQRYNRNRIMKIIMRKS